VIAWGSDANGEFIVDGGDILINNVGITFNGDDLTSLSWDTSLGDAYIQTTVGGGDVDMIFGVPLSDSVYGFEVAGTPRFELTATQANLQTLHVITDTVQTSAIHNEGNVVSMTLATDSTGRVTMVAPLVFDKTDLTIAGGAITATKGWHKVDTESSAATDDLDTINGGTAGQIVILGTVASTRDVTLKHATGNILLNGGADFPLLFTRYRCVLQYDGTNWCEIGRSA
jgi:hypothetical protein